jgi:hypothetical protein
MAVLALLCHSCGYAATDAGSTTLGAAPCVDDGPRGIHSPDSDPGRLQRGTQHLQIVATILALAAAGAVGYLGTAPPPTVALKGGFLLAALAFAHPSSCCGRRLQIAGHSACRSGCVLPVEADCTRTCNAHAQDAPLAVAYDSLIQ